MAEEPKKQYRCGDCGKEWNGEEKSCSYCGSTRKCAPVYAEGKIGISATAEAMVFRNPSKYLKDEIEEGKFIEGLVVAVMFFERFGVQKLEGYFKSKGVPIKPLDIKNYKVVKTMQLLEAFGLIDQTTHSKIGEVIEERNRAVHKLSNPEQIDSAKAKVAIEKAIDCLEAMGVA